MTLRQDLNEENVTRQGLASFFYEEGADAGMVIAMGDDGQPVAVEQTGGGGAPSGPAGGVLSGTYPDPGFAPGTNVATATALQTARAIDGQSFDGTANITVVAPGTHAAASKATPVDADELPLADSAAAYVLKKLTWANVKATLKTYFDGVYVALSLADAKGDLFAASADNTVARVAVGSDGQVLTADSAQTAGVGWAGIDGGSA